MRWEDRDVRAWGPTENEGKGNRWQDEKGGQLRWRNEGGKAEAERTSRKLLFQRHYIDCVTSGAVKQTIRPESLSAPVSLPLSLLSRFSGLGGTATSMVCASGLCYHVTIGARVRACRREC